MSRDRFYMFSIKAHVIFPTPAIVTPDEEPSLETSKFYLSFSGSCIPTNESMFILLALPTLAQTVQDYIRYKEDEVRY